MIGYAHPDLEGLCRSPHDHPAKWAFLLTMYLDESIEPNNGYAVVAGFVGTDESWSRCIREWQLVPRPKNGLHMKSLRIRESHREMFSRLGAIPRESDLILVFGSVRVSDYLDLAGGNIAAIVQSGYLTALTAILSYLMTRLDPTERLEVIFETQLEYAGMRDVMMQNAQEDEAWMTPTGLSRIAKWSSIGKSIVMEPSDYAAFFPDEKTKRPERIQG